jgi:hypothetical protein
MEPSGRNRWQPAANATAPKTAQIRETVAVGCDQLPVAFNGKEGVDLPPRPTAARVFGLIARSLPT